MVAIYRSIYIVWSSIDIVILNMIVWHDTELLAIFLSVFQKSWLMLLMLMIRVAL